MNYLDVEIFLTIAATKSITKAASILFLSQPTISHRLSALEQELSVPLFARQKGHKTVQLTDKGEEFVPIAQRWISLMKETKGLKEHQDNYFVSLGCTDSLNIALLAPFYQQQLQSNAPLDLRISTHHSAELYGLIEGHELDMAFVFHNLYYKNVIIEKFLQEKLYLMQAIPPLLPQRKVHPRNLIPEKEIFLSWDNNYDIWHDQWIPTLPRTHINVDTIALALQLWHQKEMWMIAPASVVKYFCKLRPFFVSEIDNAPPDRICYKITHKAPNLTTGRSVKYLEEQLSTYLKNLDLSVKIGQS